MKKGFFDRRIPTALALFILIAGLAVTTLLINQGVFIVSQASPEEEPQNITVTNISRDSFSVSFTTLEKTVAAVSITVDGQEQLLFDNRDGDEKKAYYSHLITVKNLDPNSNYGYKILSNGTEYPENEELFQAKTTGDTKGTAENTQMRGNVILPNGEVGADTLILILPNEGATASVVTDTNGDYTIPASLLKNAAGTAYLATSAPVPFTIKALQQNLQSTVETVFTPNGTIPPISLSQNYEFIASVDEELLATPSSLFEIPDPNISNILSILTPKKDELLVDSQPQFRGTAPAGTVVRILIDGRSSAQVRSSPNGNWSYRPSVPLSSGSHSVSAVSGGRTAVQQFSVFSSGSQIAQTATPSGALTPSIPPTSTPIPTSMPTLGAPSPTLTTPTTGSLSPTPIAVTSIPIGAPTQAVISPTPTSFVPTKIPLPPAGTAEQSILLTGVAVIFIVAGSVLFFIL